MTAFARWGQACWTGSVRSRTTWRSPNPRVREELVRSMIHRRVWLISMSVPFSEIFQSQPKVVSVSRVGAES